MKKIIKLILKVIIFMIVINNVVAISKTTHVNVIETRQLKIDFVAIDEKSSEFDQRLGNSIQFINRTYPLSDTGLITNVRRGISSSNIGSTLSTIEKFDLLKELYKEGRLSNKTDRVVGIVPQGWFFNHGQNNTKGYTYISYKNNALKTANIKAVIIEEGFRHGSAHELAHTFGICDEYNDTVWENQDTRFIFISGFCPNGDLDNDNSLDASCLDESTGCDTSTIGKLVPWKAQNDTINLFNFMGNAGDQNNRWIDNLTYIHLLEQLEEPSELLNVEKAILFSGTILKNGTLITDISYILDEQSIENQTSSGNFSIILESNGTLFYNHTFDVDFTITEIGGDTIETNVTAFAFVLPYTDNVTTIMIKENETVIKSEINVSQNTPNITITFPTGSEVFDKSFNITWNASDLDNDTIQYAILISSDNGSSLSTIEIDYPNTTLLLNSSNFINSHEYKIKILATDGINTGNDTTGTFTISNPVPPIVTLVSPLNNNISTTGNLIFNCSATDFNENLKNITLYHNISGVWAADETKNITGTSDYETFIVNNIPNGNYIWNCLAFDNNSMSDWADINFTFKVNSTSLPDINKFLIKNSSGSNIAWFGDAGNVVIKGNLEQNSNFQATDNFAFKIRNNLNDVLIIENNGSMYIDGTLFENQGTLTSDTNKNDFRIKDNSSNLVAFVNETGYVFLKGTLTQNGSP
ncbi:hypothetical protein HYX02_00405 [Candidatus Woesearchaeota archaeon]|nr:hypothetical protein [Candidatus Woesearchaeota archaeon]